MIVCPASTVSSDEVKMSSDDEFADFPHETLKNKTKKAATDKIPATILDVFSARIFIFAESKKFERVHFTPKIIYSEYEVKFPALDKEFIRRALSAFAATIRGRK